MLFAVIFACGCITPLNARAENAPAAVSYENKIEIENTINELIARNKDKTPSVSVAVFDDSRDICTVVYGESDIENGIKADENTVYEWGSISKLLAWTSAMQLYEQGKLDLDEDIRTYLPDGFLNNLSYDEPITMLNLMNHNAGFQSPYKDMETEDLDSLMPLGEALGEIAPAQIYAPGEAVAYSNWGAALAGYVVECVSGMDYADYVQENIFARLGMEHTAIRPDMSDNEWAAAQRKKTHCYAQGDDGLEPMGECRRYIHIYPAGGACGTISDLATFAKAFLQSDCPLFEKPDTLDTMLSASLYYSDRKTPRICHGFMPDDYGVTLLGHGGNTSGFSSILQLDIEYKTGFVMMTNKRGDSIYKSKLSKALYGAADLTELYSDNFEKYDLSGHYIISGGMFEKGCFGVLGHYFDRFHVAKRDGGYTGSNGAKSLTQISDDVVMIELITGVEYPYYIRADENGDFTGFENSTVDFIKISDAKYYSGLVILLLMLAGAAAMILLLVVHIIRLRKFKGSDVYKYKLREIFAGLAALAIAADIVLIFVFGLTSDAARAALCILLAALSVLLVILNIALWRSDSGRIKKAVLIIENLCSIFIVSGVVYWKMYQFWGL